MYLVPFVEYSLTQELKPIVFKWCNLLLCNLGTLLANMVIHLFYVNDDKAFLLLLKVWWYSLTVKKCLIHSEKTLATIYPPLPYQSPSFQRFNILSSIIQLDRS